MIIKYLNDLGLNCYLVKKIDSPLSTTYLINVVNLKDYNEKYIKSLLDKISVELHKDLTFEKTKEAHFKVIMEKERNTIDLATLILNTNQELNVIGIDTEDYYTTIDFEETPHLLIAGTTGSGKSILLHNILCNLFLNKHTAGKSNVLIVDPKGNELNDYKDYVNVNYIDDTKKAILLLKKVENEMDKRYKGESQYNSHIYLIIDELADLMLTSKYQAEESIVRLAQKGRACNIHLIIATQRPTIDVCTGLIKANMPDRIALKTASQRDSIVILDHKGAELLKGKGEAIYRKHGKEIHFQVAYPSEELKQTITQHYKE